MCLYTTLAGLDFGGLFGVFSLHLSLVGSGCAPVCSWFSFRSDGAWNCSFLLPFFRLEQAYSAVYRWGV